MLAYSEPPGYRRTAPIRRPKLDPYTDQIDQWLAEDKVRPRKQRHTAKRNFERLRDECGFDGGYTIIKVYVRLRKRTGKEMFMPLSHPPGHAQADFGEALVVIGGVEQKAHFFAFDLPHSDACYIRADPAATTEAWLDGHVHAFTFFGAVPQSILYDNDRCLVARILPDGTRQRTRRFSAMLSHYVIRDRYGRPGKGNDKGAVEGPVGYARRNFMVPIPSFPDWGAFNAHLEEQCRKRQSDILRGHKASIGERLQADLAAMRDLPAAPFEAYDLQSGWVTSTSVVRYRGNDYSVPVAYGHREVWIKGFVTRVVIGCAAEVTLVDEAGIACDHHETRNLGKVVMMSSLIPSEKYSCSGLPDMLSNGSTAIDPDAPRRCFAGATGVSDPDVSSRCHRQMRIGRAMFLTSISPQSTNVAPGRCRVLS